jgi:hypothetical protein
MIIFFIHRMGSSYLMQALKACKDTQIYGDYGEILTPSEINKTKFVHILNLSDRELYKYTCNKLDKYFNYLHIKSNSNNICSKISIYQVQDLIKSDDKNLLDILKKSKIIIMNRNSLDVYISMLKATKNNKWGWVDTSNMKVYIEPYEYLIWNKNFQDTYKILYDYLKDHNLSYINIDYQEIDNHDFDDYMKTKYIANKLNLEIDPDKFRTINFLVKQDKKETPDKIINYEELKNILDNL